MAGEPPQSQAAKPGFWRRETGLVDRSGDSLIVGAHPGFIIAVVTCQGSTATVPQVRYDWTVGIQWASGPEDETLHGSPGPVSPYQKTGWFGENGHPRKESNSESFMILPSSKSFMWIESKKNPSWENLELNPLSTVLLLKIE